MVNNAGIFQYPIDAEIIPMAQYRKCMAVNFFGAVEVTKVFLPLLRRSKGRLVNMCSMGGESAWWHVVTWCLSPDVELFTLCKLHKRARAHKSRLGHNESVCVFTVDLSIPFKFSHAKALFDFLLITVFIAGDLETRRCLHTVTADT